MNDPDFDKDLDVDGLDDLMDSLPFSLRNKILRKLRGEELEEELEEQGLTVEQLKDLIPEVSKPDPLVPIVRHRPEDFANEMKQVFARPTNAQSKSRLRSLRRKLTRRWS